jgi:hypothetical protein
VAIDGANVKRNAQGHGAIATLVALLSIPAAGASAEQQMSLAGQYRAVTETEITAELTLREDGTAHYTVKWFNGEASQVLRQYSEPGRWSRQGETVTVTLPLQPGTGEAGRIEYLYSPCLSYRSFGKDGCSPGLGISTTNLGRGHTWELWKADAFKP